MKLSKELLKGSLDIVVLHLLGKTHEAYGYELAEKLRQESGDVFNLQETTVYPLLYRLEEQGLVTSRRKTAPNGRERRYYSLTIKGKKALASRFEEVRQYLKGMRQVLNLSAS